MTLASNLHNIFNKLAWTITIVTHIWKADSWRHKRAAEDLGTGIVQTDSFKSIY